MHLKISHPTNPSLYFYLLQPTDEVLAEIDRIGPVSQATATLDWPRSFQGLRGWTDKLNSLWWPGTANAFATLVTLLDESRQDILSQILASQESTQDPDSFAQPHIILSAIMCGREDGYGPEVWPPNRILDPLEDVGERILIQWKLYPLQTINLSSINPEFFNDARGGAWLLPLVDIRYFQRNTAIHQAAYPHFQYVANNSSTWMPPLRGYPDDTASPSNYVALTSLGTFPGIDESWRWGDAVNAQAAMENWRVVCRDVRSAFNSHAGTNHVEFTGVVCDYPIPCPAEDQIDGGYHGDALYWHDHLHPARVMFPEVLSTFDTSTTRLGGGPCDPGSLYQSIPDRLQFIVPAAPPSSKLAQHVIQRKVAYPATVADFSRIPREMSESEKIAVPVVRLQTIKTASPSVVLTDIVRWALLYHLWRRPQAVLKFLGIAPLIPNGHAHAIRWDFSTKLFETTYIAVDGINSGIAEGQFRDIEDNALTLGVAENIGNDFYPNWQHADVGSGINHLDFTASLAANRWFYTTDVVPAWRLWLDVNNKKQVIASILETAYGQPGIVNLKPQFLGRGLKVVEALGINSNVKTHAHMLVSSHTNGASITLLAYGIYDHSRTYGEYLPVQALIVTKSLDVASSEIDAELSPVVAHSILLAPSTGGGPLVDPGRALQIQGNSAYFHVHAPGTDFIYAVSGHPVYGGGSFRIGNNVLSRFLNDVFIASRALTLGFDSKFDMPGFGSEFNLGFPPMLRPLGGSSPNNTAAHITSNRGWLGVYNRYQGTFVEDGFAYSPQLVTMSGREVQIRSASSLTLYSPRTVIGSDPAYSNIPGDLYFTPATLAGKVYILRKHVNPGSFDSGSPEYYLAESIGGRTEVTSGSTYRPAHYFWKGLLVYPALPPINLSNTGNFANTGGAYDGITGVLPYQNGGLGGQGLIPGCLLTFIGETLGGLSARVVSIPRTRTTSDGNVQFQIDTNLWAGNGPATYY